MGDLMSDAYFEGARSERRERALRAGDRERDAFEGAFGARERTIELVLRKLKEGPLDALELLEPRTLELKSSGEIRYALDECTIKMGHLEVALEEVSGKETSFAGEVRHGAKILALSKTEAAELWEAAQLRISENIDLSVGAMRRDLSVLKRTSPKNIEWRRLQGDTYTHTKGESLFSCFVQIDVQCSDYYFAGFRVPRWDASIQRQSAMNATVELPIGEFASRWMDAIGAKLPKGD